MNSREKSLIRQAIKTQLEELEAYIDILDKDILFEDDSDMVFELLATRNSTHDKICEYNDILDKLKEV